MYFTLLYSSLKPNTVSFAFSSYGNEPEIKSLRDSDVQTYEFLHSHLHTDHIGYNYYYQNLDSRFQRYAQNIHPNHFIGNKIYRPLYSLLFIRTNRSIIIRQGVQLFHCIIPSLKLVLLFSDPLNFTLILLGLPLLIQAYWEITLVTKCILGNLFRMNYVIQYLFYGALVLLTTLSIF